MANKLIKRTFRQTFLRMLDQFFGLCAFTLIDF